MPQIKTRSDISGSLFHLTRARTGKNPKTGLQVLCEILGTKKIKGSGNLGYVKGKVEASCFTESPLSSLIEYLPTEDSKSRYECYGIAFSKKSGFKAGARPVIYLPDNESQWIPEQEKWRLVQLSYDHGIDWTHEREWRIKGDLDLSQLAGFYIIHHNPSEQKIIRRHLDEKLKKLVRGYLPMEHLAKIL
ncbi:hypothetical protein QD172_01855 [Cobetia sp. 10Alg 146]|uniref:hypothetical protein n=1 Tax=Cobetia sp. 10Alg 146 TaxID=3040019 RepID=UPI00244D309B|nr:hypothetical protein [Cobetia sp. 10Alg 146]MDH2289995.1 hypothetical protein [Cobetia sp. 10Alg 146]